MVKEEAVGEKKTRSMLEKLNLDAVGHSIIRETLLMFSKEIRVKMKLGDCHTNE